MWRAMGLSVQRRVLTVFISLCTFITVTDGHGPQGAMDGSQSPGTLTNEDQAEIIRSVFEHAIAHPVTTFQISWAEIVSSENMTASMLPKISGYKFELLEPEKIEQKANRSGYIRYLVFSKIRVRDGKVNVGVCRVTIGSCFGWFSSNTCFSGEYHKESGSWTGELKPSLATVLKPAPLRLRL